MKLTLKISAAIVLLLLISVYGYLQIRASHSYDQQVAKNASVVYKLNLDGLLKTMATDFIGNPGYYLKQNEKGKRRPDFSIPANVFAYSLKTMAPSTFFSGLTLSDTAGLNAYLKRVLKIKDFSTIAGKGGAKASTGAKNTIGTSADRKITVVYNEKTLGIAYSFKREAVMEELNDILDRKNRMEDAAPLMIALKKAEGHLSWTAAAYGGQVNFKDGRAEMKGTFPTEGLNIPDHPRLSVKFADKALIKMWVNAGFKTSLTDKGPAMPKASVTHRTFEMFKEFSLKGSSLDSDSLLKPYMGFAAFEMAPGITQIDSLIAYEYNDDFEKVATVQLKKVTVPHLKLSIAAKTGDLLEYLKVNQVLSTDERLNKELFPLYQVFSSQKDNIWQLSTLKNDAIKPVSVLNADFFSVSADLNGIKAQQLFPLLNSWLKPYAHLKITAAKLDSETARLNGRLEFQHENINAFIQMIWSIEFVVHKLI